LFKLTGDKKNLFTKSQYKNVTNILARKVRTTKNIIKWYASSVEKETTVVTHTCTLRGECTRVPSASILNNT